MHIGTEDPGALLHLKAVGVVVTTACNLECTYCFETIRNTKEISFAHLQTAVDLVARHGGPECRLGFTGGEPLLALPLIQRAVAFTEATFLHGARPPLVIATNGMLLDRAAARFLASKRIQTRLSFDGAAQDLRAPATFEHLDATIRRIRLEEPALFHDLLTVVFTLTSTNMRLLAESVAYYLALGLKRIEIFPLSTHDPNWSSEHHGELDRQMKLLCEHSKAHLEQTGELPISLLHAQKPRSTEADSPVCAAGRGDTLLMDVDGRLFGCAMLAESYQRLPDPWRQRFHPRCHDSADASPPRKPARAMLDRAKASGLFHHSKIKRSSFARCGDCRWITTCTNCPMATVHIPGNKDPHRVSDLQCIFNHVVHEHRERFRSQLPATSFLGDVPIAMQEITEAVKPRNHTRR